VVLGNVRDRSELAQACQGIEWVVHRAAIVLPLSEENHDLAHSVNNIEGT
jgi:FlaA1/EpsC-like NDP-sugar epimerase